MVVKFNYPYRVGYIRFIGTHSARLDVLATLVDAHEAKHFPIDPPDPIEAIKFRVEQMGLKRMDLEPLLGGRSRVSEVLSGKRSLSIQQIRILHAKLRIPYENLLGAATSTRA